MARAKINGDEIVRAVRRMLGDLAEDDSIIVSFVIGGRLCEVQKQGMTELCSEGDDVVLQENLIE